MFTNLALCSKGKCSFHLRIFSGLKNPKTSPSDLDAETSVDEKVTNGNDDDDTDDDDGNDVLDESLFEIPEHYVEDPTRSNFVVFEKLTFERRC